MRAKVTQDDINQALLRSTRIESGASVRGRRRSLAEATDVLKELHDSLNWLQRIFLTLGRLIDMLEDMKR